MKEKYNKMGKEESWILDMWQGAHGEDAAWVKTRSEYKPLSTPGEEHLEVRDMAPIRFMMSKILAHLKHGKEAGGAQRG